MQIYLGIIFGIFTLVCSTPFKYHANNELLASIDKLYDEEFDKKQPVGPSKKFGDTEKRNILREALKQYGEKNIESFLDEKDSKLDGNMPPRNPAPAADNFDGNMPPRNPAPAADNFDGNMPPRNPAPAADNFDGNMPPRNPAPAADNFDKDALLGDIAREALANMRGEHVEDSLKTRDMDAEEKRELVNTLAREIAADMKNPNRHNGSPKDKVKDMIESEIKKRIQAKEARGVVGPPGGPPGLDAPVDENAPPAYDNYEKRQKITMIGKKDHSEGNEKDEKLILHDIAREVVADMKGDHVEDSESTKNIDENKKREVLHNLALEIVKDKMRKKDASDTPLSTHDKLKEMIEDDIFSKMDDNPNEKYAKDVILHDLAKSLNAQINGGKYVESDEVKDIDEQTKRAVLHKLAKEMVADMKRRSDDSGMPLNHHEKVKRIVENAIMKRIKETKAKEVTPDLDEKFKKELKEKILEKIAEKREKKNDEKLILHDIAKEVVADIHGEKLEDSEEVQDIDASLKKEVLHKLAVGIVKDMHKKRDSEPSNEREKLKQMVEQDIMKKINKKSDEEAKHRAQLKDQIYEKLEEKMEKKEAEEKKEAIEEDAKQRDEIKAIILAELQRRQAKNDFTGKSNQEDNIRKELKEKIKEKLAKRLQQDRNSEGNFRKEIKTKIEKKLAEKFQNKRKSEATKTILNELGGRLMSDIRHENVPSQDALNDIDEQTKREVLHKLAKEIVADMKKQKDEDDNESLSARDKLKRAIEEDIMARISQKDSKQSRFADSDIDMKLHRDQSKEIQDEIASLREEKKELVGKSF